jgi:hypothetical protein
LLKINGKCFYAKVIIEVCLLILMAVSVGTNTSFQLLNSVVRHLSNLPTYHSVYNPPIVITNPSPLISCTSSLHPPPWEREGMNVLLINPSQHNPASHLPATTTHQLPHLLSIPPCFLLLLRLAVIRQTHVLCPRTLQPPGYYFERTTDKRAGLT